MTSNCFLAVLSLISHLSIIIVIISLHYSEVSSSNWHEIGFIQNISLIVSNTTSSFINGTCDECRCNMLTNARTISAFNCFRMNNTCELFLNTLQSKSFSIMHNPMSSLHFFPYFIDGMITVNQTTTPSKSIRSEKSTCIVSIHYSTLLLFSI